MPLRPEAIIWRGKIFPKYEVTYEMLERYVYAYPNVDDFQDQFRKWELWVYTNPSKRPQRWAVSLNNWLRKHSQYLKSHPSMASKPKPAEYGDSARELNVTPRSFAEILNNIRAHSSDERKSNET